MAEKSALIGMSGGVDSSVAALLTQQAGCRCIGGTMRLFDSGCGSGDADDARAVARRLGMEHRVFPMEEEFAELVIGEFSRCYLSGVTPNPCIRCNRYLKFGLLLDRALELGCDYVVSGHYARIRREEATGRYLLYKAADSSKDQTYFLAGLDQRQLSHILFPLGELSKQEVRAIAQEHGFLNARKRDSQDICFIPGGDYGAFLEEYTHTPFPPGDYLDLSGKVIGRHRGAARYTLGQRKGLGIALGAPAYVCAKDMAANTVTLGPNEALYSRALRGNDWTFYPFPALTEPMEVTVKVRHSQHEQAAVAFPEEDGFVRVEFAQPQRAVTPGQAVVLYRDDLVVGGGTITHAIP